MSGIDSMRIRLSRPADREAIERLATLDSAAPPAGALLLAESDARIIAALPLGSGRPIADPFEPTAGVLALLELRASQLRGEGGGRPTRLARLRQRLASRQAPLATRH
jgi:hypothetical protein